MVVIKEDLRYLHVSQKHRNRTIFYNVRLRFGLAWLGVRVVQGLCLAGSIRCNGVSIKNFAISVVDCCSLA
jgi:hypothetical protein